MSLSLLDWMIMAAILLLMLLIDRSAGSRRGFELMPWPDGLEYAASAVNLGKGRGAVLHFGGYTYPSRYTGGYPLILEFFYRLLAGHFQLFVVASLILGMVSIVVIFILHAGLFGRTAGTSCGALARALAGIHHVFVVGDERRADVVRDDVRRARC